MIKKSFFLVFFFLISTYLQAFDSLPDPKIFRGEIVREKLNPVNFSLNPNECRIILVRHGQTEWNKEGRSQGLVNVPLNEEGRFQARQLAHYFSDLSIGAIYCSHLSRALETAWIISMPHDEIKLIEDSTLRFYDPQQKNGTLKSEEEIGAEISERALTYLQNLSLEHSGENIVIVTHGKVIKHVVETLCKDKESFPIKIDNAAIVRILGIGDILTLEA